MRTREEQALVEYDECAGCGATRRTEVTIDGERFDPRSRFQGYLRVCLWDDHPWDGKDLCDRCVDAERYVDDVGREVPHMVRVRIVEVERCCDGDVWPCHKSKYCQGGWIFGERGLRLASAPPTPEQLKREYVTAWLLDDAKSRALWLYPGFCGYWLPNPGLGSRNGRWLSDLACGDRLVAICEPTATTPWPTVFEPYLVAELEAREESSARWGQEIVRRANGKEVAVCAVRVPMEILQ